MTLVKNEDRKPKTHEEQIIQDVALRGFYPRYGEVDLIAIVAALARRYALEEGLVVIVNAPLEDMATETENPVEATITPSAMIDKSTVKKAVARQGKRTTGK